MRFTWDEAKRLSNLAKHGFDFRDAGLVYDAPHKLTNLTERHGGLRMRRTSSDTEAKEYCFRVGEVFLYALDKLIQPIYDEHPELKPPGWVD